MIPLAELEAMAEKATPRPWSFNIAPGACDEADLMGDNGNIVVAVSADDLSGAICHLEDAKFIVALVNGFEDILKRLEDAERKAEAGEVLVREVEVEQENESRRTDQMLRAFMKSPWSPEFLSPMENTIEELSKSHIIRTKALSRYRAAIKD